MRIPLVLAWGLLSAASPPPQDKKTLTVVTYNILGEPHRPDERIPVLMKILKESDADVIGLQEVVPWFQKRLAKEEWAKKYQVQALDPESVGGQFILSKFPIENARSHVLPGPQRRTVVVATIRVDGRRLDIATTHLESPLQDGPVRAKQLDAIFSRTKGADDAVVTGDFNFGDGEEEEKRIPAEYTDLWKALKPGDPGFTWNNETSDMAGKSKDRFPGEKSRRLDRILVRSSVWKPKEVKILGDQPVVAGKKDLFPSDHFGVIGILTRD
jgi:tyrosyl-DNA phosphodiesterase 2